MSAGKQWFEFTPEQRAQCDADLADPIVADALRLIAWRKLGKLAEDFCPVGWPDQAPESERERIWWEQNIVGKKVDDAYDWDAPWRLRARALDARQMSLDALQRELEGKAATLAAAEAQEAALNAGPTDVEAKALDIKRTAAWVRLKLGDEAYNHIDAVDRYKFAYALGSVPVAGWPDGRGDKEHLRDMRTVPAAPEYVEPIDEGEGGALAALLGGAP